MKKINKNKIFTIKKDRKELLESLEENTAYLIKVTHTSSNPEHEAILFMGFYNGAYCEIYVNNYDLVVGLHRVYTVKVIKKLHTFK